MEYNLLDQEADGVFAKARAAGVGVISRVPLKRGLLTGRIDEQTHFVEGDRRRNILAPDKLPAMVARVKRIAEVVSDYGRPLAEVAVRFCVSNPNVSLTIPGIRTPEQARANAAASEPLPADVLQKLRQID
jgi:aryl-alcohol dehydrogenase-like predicted oxidoreductase